MNPHDDFDQWDGAMQALTQQRDAALAERDKARTDANLYQLNSEEWSEVGAELKAALTEARRVLRSVQWSVVCVYTNTPDKCPSCGRIRWVGHKEDCVLAAVPAQEEK